MATLPRFASPDSYTVHPKVSSSYACLFFRQCHRRSHHLSALGRQGCSRRSTTRPTVTCDNSGDGLRRSLERLDRRDVVLGGLGGLAALGLDRSAALAADCALSGGPIAPPDLSKCHFATPDSTITPDLECCPPLFKGQTPVDFTFPTFTKLRVRPAVHGLTTEYEEKFKRAIKLMKDLPGDDPRNFFQQANVHCAYCNDAYDQVGVPDAEKNDKYIQVHNSWLFFPWHRIYLYYYERILGKLLGDENFAIPFWNWDHPDGMVMPAIYADPRSPLYDPNRNPKHFPPTAVILDYAGKDPDPPVGTYHQIGENLVVMHRQMIWHGKSADSFMGGRFVTGCPPNPRAGSMELCPHNNIHDWLGNPANPFGEDMGNFYSAARDPLFYGHHANVDRMWFVWNKILRNCNFDDSNWLNAAFYFYDENKQVVRVKVSDALDTEKLRYAYEDRQLPWLSTPPLRKQFLAEEVRDAAARTAPVEFPLTLGSPVNTVVKRPMTARSKKQKATEEEVLVIDIQVEMTVFTRFDVLVNAPDETGRLVTPSAAEFAGSFTHLPHKPNPFAKARPRPANLALALPISELLDEIGADGDDQIVVTLVPRKGEGKITIGDIGIEYRSLL